MSLYEMIAAGGGGVILLLTLVQIAPIKVNPWSALFAAMGRAINRDVMKKLEEVKSAQKSNTERLNEHIRLDNERNADERRTRILRFNNELVRNIPHTKEEFVDVLADVDEYEAYCRDHPEYKNSRAVHAIANIGRVYDERLQKHDFL